MIIGLSEVLVRTIVERCDGIFEFLILIGNEFHRFPPDSETAFCPIAVLR